MGGGRAVKPGLGVVIPSRNGLPLLERLLPVLSDPGGLEIIVVDDNSRDGTWETLKEKFPTVRVFRRRSSPGFCHAVNLGMSRASSDLVVLLNNDVMPEPGCFTGMRAALEAASRDVAVMVPRIIRPDGSDDGGYEWGFRRGLAFTAPGAGNPYPSGACAMWRRGAWSALGGLSTSYTPIYWEDADMGAKLTGFGMRMERYPGPGVSHDHGATMGTGLESRVIRERNRFIFMDRWCSSRAMRFSTLAWLPVHLASAGLKGNRAFTMGYRSYRKWKHGV